MLPSWFTRLRDVKAGSKHKELNKLRDTSPAAKRFDKDPASFAKAWSLQRANTKAKGARTEADITSTCDYSYPPNNDEVTHLGGAENVRSMQELEISADASALSIHPHANLDPWDRDFISMSSGKRASDSMLCKEVKASVQKGQGVSDNDTEDFALTSETRSSFCSETSSADSSVSCKGGCEEKGSQDERHWQEGDVCTKSSGLVSKGLLESCTAGQKNGSGCAELTSGLMSTCYQKSAQMHRELWRRRGRFFFSYLTVGRHKSAGSNAEVRNISYDRSAGGESLKTSEVFCHLQSDGKLMKKNVDSTSSKLSKREQENFTPTKNLPSIKHNKSNAETPNESPEESSTAAEAGLNFGFDHDDTYRYTSVGSEKCTADPLAQNVSLEKRDGLHSPAEYPSATVSTIGSAATESAEERKGKVFSTRRRRHRGASISAVLPPDLQGVVGDSLALVKMSDDPYEDFRQSIYEMIMEKDLEGSMDVEELLYCYLTLNAPEHHELIEEVFSDVWSAILMTLR